jgi:hypothetical protein
LLIVSFWHSWNCVLRCAAEAIREVEHPDSVCLCGTAPSLLPKTDILRLFSFCQNTTQVGTEGKKISWRHHDLKLNSGCTCRVQNTRLQQVLPTMGRAVDSLDQVAKEPLRGDTMEWWVSVFILEKNTIHKFCDRTSYFFTSILILYSHLCLDSRIVFLSSFLLAHALLHPLVAYLVKENLYSVDL